MDRRRPKEGTALMMVALPQTRSERLMALKEIGIFDSPTELEQKLDSLRAVNRQLASRNEDLEKSVLSRAVRLALQKKILSYGNKTVIFD